jgi:hypothetical protein
MEKEISIRAFAKEMGVSHVLILNAIRAGKIRKGLSDTKKIIPEIARQECYDNCVGKSVNSAMLSQANEKQVVPSVNSAMQFHVNEMQNEKFCRSDCKIPIEKQMEYFKKFTRIWLVEVVEVLSDILTDWPDLDKNMFDQTEEPEWFFDALDERLEDRLTERRESLLGKLNQ